MFENMNPLDRSTAFIEIGILLLVSFILGFVAAKIPLSALQKSSKKENNTIADNEEVDPRDIITEPTTIKAVLTRDRKGNAMASIQANKKLPDDTIVD